MNRFCEAGDEARRVVFGRSREVPEEHRESVVGLDLVAEGFAGREFFLADEFVEGCGGRMRSARGWRAARFRVFGEAGATWVHMAQGSRSLQDILGEADVVTIMYLSRQATHHLIGAREWPGCAPPPSSSIPLVVRLSDEAR